MARATLNGLIGGIGGSVDGLVFVRTAGGIVVRPKPRKAPRTAGQRAQEDRVRLVAALWAGVDAEGAQAWRRYAEGLVANRPAGARRPMSAYNAFLALAGRRLQVAPGEPVPLEPPAFAFVGDAVRLAARGTAGGILFAADRANSEGVVTEMLTQPLAGAARLPRTGAYASRGFVAFAAGGLEATVARRPGAHACAARFVDRETGQATDLVPLGIVTVGAPL